MPLDVDPPALSGREAETYRFSQDLDLTVDPTKPLTSLSATAVATPTRP